MNPNPRFKKYQPAENIYTSPSIDIPWTLFYTCAGQVSACVCGMSGAGRGMSVYTWCAPPVFCSPGQDSAGLTSSLPRSGQCSTPCWAGTRRRGAHCGHHMYTWCTLYMCVHMVNTVHVVCLYMCGIRGNHHYTSGNKHT